MKLSMRLADHFAPVVRKRGQQCYSFGLVRIRHGSDSLVTANVQGSYSYPVTLKASQTGLQASCDCPWCRDGNLCKHIWATILAAEARGYLSDPMGARSLDVVAMHPPDLETDAAEQTKLFPERKGAVPPRRQDLDRQRPPRWKKDLAVITSLSIKDCYDSAHWPARRKIVYEVAMPNTSAAGKLALRIRTRDHRSDGSVVRTGGFKWRRGNISQLPLQEDREILSALLGGASSYGLYGNDGYQSVPDSLALTPPLAALIMPMIARTNRCFLQNGDQTDASVPLEWDDGEPWRLELEIQAVKQGWALLGFFRRGEDRLDLAAPAVVTRNLLITRERIARLAEDAPLEWILHLRNVGSILADPEEIDEFLAELLHSGNLPAPLVPEPLRYQEIAPEPGCQLRIGSATSAAGKKLRAYLSFCYDGWVVEAEENTPGIFQIAERRWIRRNPSAEKAAGGLLESLNAKFRAPVYEKPFFEITAAALPPVVRTLIGAGWHIEADGRLFRTPANYRMEVSSGVDWFELRGEVQYEDRAAPLPALLAAVHRGESVVRLDDGSFGIIPEEWLGRIGMLARLGTPENGHIRFGRNQAGLLDALLAAQPEARCDETFARVREELVRFQGVEAAAQPAGFVGQLRDYQRDGLGWMEFLRRFSFGGCLADDMGVGKTAQVLALLEKRRAAHTAGEPAPPSLVVVPKSLVFNWAEEAARFTPELRILNYTGTGRNSENFESCDVVLTTYGTVRREAARLKDFEFDYVVLDEAQAIKNAATESAKAVRLLRARHRLALSGTPVENHLGELFSLFEFLNPGMLGTASVLKLASTVWRNPDEHTRALLAHALRPFILRRTKEQVARELPSKTEQTIHCEMEPPQRKLYDELRQHYRAALLRRLDKEGLAKLKIQVLEALLRLRQAACHPGLIDPERSGEASAKLDILQHKLREVMEEGHKALVFSQFTSFLKIVRERLDQDEIAYEYLDGATVDRQARVERFQSDPECRLFLISLKAGGLGLNLTAAEYVFLLDPWWNPAVEAQAIDRAHRIGQTRQVVAYRLIARDTVEEKVLELQRTKRDLAGAIIGEDNGLIRNLGREDLELLLS